MMWDSTDAGFTAIKIAFFGNLAIGLAVMGGEVAAAGSQGLQADFSITQFSREEPLEEAILVKIQAKVTYSATAPQWVTV